MRPRDYTVFYTLIALIAFFAGVTIVIYEGGSSSDYTECPAVLIAHNSSLANYTGTLGLTLGDDSYTIPCGPTLNYNCSFTVQYAGNRTASLFPLSSSFLCCNNDYPDLCQNLSLCSGLGCPWLALAPEGCILPTNLTIYTNPKFPDAAYLQNPQPSTVSMVAYWFFIVEVLGLIFLVVALCAYRCFLVWQERDPNFEDLPTGQEQQTSVD